MLTRGYWLSVCCAHTELSRRLTFIHYIPKLLSDIYSQTCKCLQFTVQLWQSCCIKPASQPLTNELLLTFFKYRTLRQIPLTITNKGRDGLECRNHCRVLRHKRVEVKVLTVRNVYAVINWLRCTMRFYVTYTSIHWFLPHTISV